MIFAVLAPAASATEFVFQLPPEARGLGARLQAASLGARTVRQKDAGPQDILAAARADYARLAGALYETGHYGAVISIRIDGREAADIAPLDTPGRIDRVVVRVVPGPPFTFSRAEVKPLAPGTDLPQGYRPGGPALARVITDAAAAGVTRWREAGHARAAVDDQRIVADHRNARLSSEIVLAPGPRLSFGELRIMNETAVRSERVRAIAGLPTGRVFSPQALESAARRLRRTGAFRSVTLAESGRVGPGDRLDIEATLADARPHRIGAGAELSSLEGLRLSGFWLHRNLLGGAERLRIGGEFGGIGGDSGGVDFSLSARFDRPATLNPDTGMFLEARVQALDEPEYRENNLRIGGGLTRSFSDTLRGEAGLAYQYSDIDDDIGTRQLEHLLFPARLTLDTRDDPLDAARGAYLDLDATPFAALDGGGSGARLYLDSRSYRALRAGGRLVLATRSQLGTVAGAGLAEVPADMLFYSGGAGTVRGQPYQSLGVDLGAGRQVGGRSFAAVSAELRARVRGDWSLVAFADAGFVGRDSWWDTTSSDTHAGAGLGVRYDTGLGPIRVDVATPLDDAAGETLELYIGIGEAF